MMWETGTSRERAPRTRLSECRSIVMDRSSLALALAHILFGKPASTFPGYALMSFSMLAGVRCRLRGFRHHSQKFDGLIAQVLAGMPSRRNPLDRARRSAIVGRCSVLRRISQVRVGEPDHETRA